MTYLKKGRRVYQTNKNTHIQILIQTPKASYKINVNLKINLIICLIIIIFNY